jgi:predicted aldo/keto reductase-like oxidoreductase
MSNPRPNLPKRRLGKTDLMATVVGFGGIPIQSVGQDDAIATVRRAHDLGVNFFDTARGYTTSEERIGKALEGRDYIIATKSPARDANAVLAHIDLSLAALRRDRIDLFQLHAVNNDDALAQVLASGGALEGALKAREAGKIVDIGITGHRYQILMKAVEECGEFATVQVPINLVEDEAIGALLPLCAERNLGVIAMKPVGGGNFTNAPLAVKWCLNQAITVAIPGMQTVGEVEQDVGVAQNPIELTAEEQAQCVAMKSELDRRTCRRCQYCEPCPNGVKIHTLVYGRSIIRRMGVARFLEWGGREAIASAEQCVECGECITKCPYDLPIPELIGEALEYYEAIPELKPG